MGTTFPDELKRLVEQFHQQFDRIRTDAYNETQVRIDFIDPMMKSLGWDMNNAQGFAEQYREVVHEDRVKVGGQTKAPDYSFRIGGTRKFFLEAKKPSVNVKTDVAPAYQLRRYAWSAKLAVSLLTDFEEFAVYDTRVRPKELDKASEARREYLRYTDYESRWDFISGTFSKDAVLRGEFDRYCETKKGRGAQAVDEAFLDEIEEWRKLIAVNLARRNESLDEGGLNFATQRIIDRIIFLRIAEDRGTEAPGQLQSLLKTDDVYRGLVTLFNRADERYNSGLFHFAKEKDRDEAHDALTPTLDVDDKTLKTVVKALYYPQSPYEFSMLSADILGSVYERFLGKVITLSANHTARIEEKPEVRKAGGVYYTPTYIVDYIVRQTVGKLLDGKTPKEAAKLKVLDPACGSGSFLIGAYQFLLDWYHAQYTADPAGAAALAQGKAAVLRPATLNPNAAPSPGPVIAGWSLTIAERKRILLDHIHGVDLDGQAVEVTKLNLLLKCLEGETSATLGFEQRLFRERALPDLGKNILCGNSLIGTDIVATDAWKEMSDEEKTRMNPFDYARAFSKLKRDDGFFDAVIGNPPWLMPAYQDDAPLEYLKTRFKAATGKYDLYYLFMEDSSRLLSRSGRFGMIVPNKFFHTKAAAALRSTLATEGGISEIIDFGDAQIFRGATNYSCILLRQKGHATAQFRYIKAGANLVVNETRQLASASLDSGTWNFAHGDTKTLFAKMLAASVPLAEITERFGTGAQTGADRVYTVVADDGAEPEATRSLIKGRDVRRYQPVRPVSRIIFPHRDAGGAFELIEEAALRRIAPKAAAHLAKSKEKLATRIWFGKTATELSGAWYGLMYLDDSKWFQRPHILSPALSNHSNFSLGTGDIFATGTAGVVSIVPDETIGEDIRYILGLLNSSLLSFFITRHSPPFSGGFFKFSAPYLRKVPIRRVAFGKVSEKKRHDQVVSFVDSALALRTRLAAEQLPQRKEQIQREIDATDRQIDQLVYALYGLTADEIAIVEAATA